MEPMTPTLSKTREQAELAFSKIQSQFIARGQADQKRELVVEYRNSKTLRLREARLKSQRDARVS